ncbi:hypothetical protein C8034_v004774 [Colletotrichum sidae]|uniref:Uncharacterized protein n=1 Tax=Colletotrichum sidae TaxID=1347389 RepID=A0A4R8T6X5_9PEZI|nr:hypothetical protein C8034_v004774 [Colletotrichum sidae]
MTLLLALCSQLVQSEVLFTEARSGALSFTCDAWYGLMHKTISMDSKGEDARGSTKVTVTTTQSELIFQPQSIIVPRAAPNTETTVVFDLTTRFCPGRALQVRKDELCHATFHVKLDYYVATIQGGPFRPDKINGGWSGIVQNSATVKAYCITTTEDKCVAPGAVVRSYDCHIVRFSLS